MPSIKLQNREWYIATPTLFRFMDSKYIDAFFNDGSLRISSFSRFKKHKDEQRMDKDEGKAMFVHITTQGGKQTITVTVEQGISAYILSTTMRYDKDFLDMFNVDSYIRINNSSGFGEAIAKKIENFNFGYEGACLYQDIKIVHKDLGYIDINKFRDPQNPQPPIDQAKIPPEGLIIPPSPLLKEYIFSQIGHYPIFLKDKKFAHQTEYRFAWETKVLSQEYIDIKVPEAIQFCEKPDELTQ
jgi:hypothetical protein